ncbi:hypothetical protein TKK_0003450 [Trichogramma kaykai]
MTCKHFPNKKSIAHRDFKPQNILVKANGSCTIGDLGLAVMKGPNTGKVDIPIESIAGTVRYLAPEVLSNTIDKTSVEDFQKGDVYSLALVMWEVAMRSELNPDEGIKYRKAYEENLGEEPGIEEMRKVVFENHIRPEIPRTWASIETLKNIAIIIKQCWSQNPTERPTSNDILAQLQRMQQGSNNTQDIENHFNCVLNKTIAMFGFALELSSNETNRQPNPVAIRVAQTLIEERAELHIYDPRVEESQIRSNLIIPR